MIENDEIQSEPLETYHVYIWKEEEPETVIDSTPPVKVQPRDNHGAILMLISSIVMGFIVAFAPSSPISEQIAFMHTFRLSDLQSYLLLPVTSHRSITVAATGRGHEGATHARGYLTFYNGLFTSQTIAQGTIFTGADGVQVVTDQDAFLPPANPPVFGQASVPAHALHAGAAGNIPSYAIDDSCCVTSVKAVNTGDFTGGENARDYHTVTKQDIVNGATSLTQSLYIQEQTALHAELTSDAVLIRGNCSTRVTSNHHVGEEAARVTLHVSATCSASAYSRKSLQEKARQLLHIHTDFRLNSLLVHVVRTTPTSVTVLIKCKILYNFTERKGTR